MQDFEMLERRLKGWALFLFHNKEEKVLPNTFIEVYSPEKMLFLSRCNLSPKKKGYECYFNRNGTPFAESRLCDMRVIDFMIYLSEVVPNFYSDFSSSYNFVQKKFSSDILGKQMCGLPIMIEQVDDGIWGLQRMLRDLVLYGVTKQHYVPDFY